MGYHGCTCSRLAGGADRLSIAQVVWDTLGPSQLVKPRRESRRSSASRRSMLPAAIQQSRLSAGPQGDRLYLQVTLITLVGLVRRVLPHRDVLAVRQGPFTLVLSTPEPDSAVHSHDYFRLCVYLVLPTGKLPGRPDAGPALEKMFFGDTYPKLIDNSTGFRQAQVWKYYPSHRTATRCGLGEVDNALIEGARDVGAGSLRIFGSILFPLPYARG